MAPIDPAPVDLATLRVAISEDLGFAPVDRDIRRRFRNAMDEIWGVFAQVEERNPDMTGADEAFEGVRALYFLAKHGENYRTNKDVLGPNIVANVEQGHGMSLADAAEAMKIQTRIYRDFLDFMADFDVLICPAMAIPPFPHEQLHPTHINGEPLRTYFHWLALPYGLTLTAHPVVCIPCGRDPTGMPFGIQVCGKRHGDLGVLAIGAALEQYMGQLPDLARPLPDLAKLAA